MSSRKSRPTREPFRRGSQADVMQLTKSFVPKILIEGLSRVIDSNPIFTLQPLSVFFESVCLIVDISGFTRLSGNYCAKGKDGIDNLQQVINNFIGLLVEIIYFYGGDIIKFAGDAIICLFALPDSYKKFINAIERGDSDQPVHGFGIVLSPSDKNNNDGYTKEIQEKEDNLLGSNSEGGDFGVADDPEIPLTPKCDNPVDALARSSLPSSALQCALELSNCRSEQLSVHVGLSAGEICFAMLGGVSDKWENLISGECISHLSQCLDDASSTEVAVTPAFLNLLSKDNRALLRLEELKSGNTKVWKDYHPSRKAERSKSMMRWSQSRDLLCDDGNLMYCLSQFVPYPIFQSLAMSEMNNVAELREVTVIFMKWDSYSFEQHRDLLQLQSLFRTAQEILAQTGAFIRQFLVDDKGCVLIACWGVPTASYMDNAARALSAAALIRNAFLRKDFAASFGITTGNVYCGTVGSMVRREYAAIGNIVNLSARLMCKAGGGILLDDATYSRLPLDAANVLKKLVPITVKGKTEPIQIYSYDSRQILVKSLAIAGKTEGIDTEPSGEEYIVRQSHKNTLLRVLDSVSLSLFSTLKRGLSRTISRKSIKTDGSDGSEYGNGAAGGAGGGGGGGVGVGGGGVQRGQVAAPFAASGSMKKAHVPKISMMFSSTSSEPAMKIVYIEGKAGSGKASLMRWFKQECSSVRSMHVVSLELTASDHQYEYRTLLLLFQQLIGIEAFQSDEQQESIVMELLEELHPSGGGGRVSYEDSAQQNAARNTTLAVMKLALGVTSDISLKPARVREQRQQNRAAKGMHALTKRLHVVSRHLSQEQIISSLLSIFEHFFQLLECVICIEGLHFADQPSLAVLLRFAFMNCKRMLVLSSLPPEDIPSGGVAGAIGDIATRSIKTGLAGFGSNRLKALKDIRYRDLDGITLKQFRQQLLDFAKSDPTASSPSQAAGFAAGVTSSSVSRAAGHVTHLHMDFFSESEIEAILGSALARKSCFTSTRNSSGNEPDNCADQRNGSETTAIGGAEVNSKRGVKRHSLTTKSTRLTAPASAAGNAVAIPRGLARLVRQLSGGSACWVREIIDHIARIGAAEFMLAMQQHRWDDDHFPVDELVPLSPHIGPGIQPQPSVSSPTALRSSVDTGTASPTSTGAFVVSGIPGALSGPNSPAVIGSVSKERRSFGDVDLNYSPVSDAPSEIASSLCLPAPRAVATEAQSPSAAVMMPIRERGDSVHQDSKDEFDNDDLNLEPNHAPVSESPVPLSSPRYSVTSPSSKPAPFIGKNNYRSMGSWMGDETHTSDLPMRGLNPTPSAKAEDLVCSLSQSSMNSIISDNIQMETSTRADPTGENIRLGGGPQDGNGGGAGTEQSLVTAQLQAFIISRFESLQTIEQRVLKFASMIGKEFEYNILYSLLPARYQPLLAGLMHTLVKAYWLIERTAPVCPAPSFTSLHPRNPPLVETSPQDQQQQQQQILAPSLSAISQQASGEQRTCTTRRFKFVHFLVRRTIYELTPSSERVVVHMRIADFIYDNYGQDPAYFQLLSRQFRFFDRDRTFEFTCKAALNFTSEDSMDASRCLVLLRDAARYCQSAVDCKTVLKLVAHARAVLLHHSKHLASRRTQYLRGNAKLDSSPPLRKNISAATVQAGAVESRSTCCFSFGGCFLLCISPSSSHGAVIPYGGIRASEQYLFSMSGSSDEYELRSIPTGNGSGAVGGSSKGGEYSYQSKSRSLISSAALGKINAAMQKLEAELEVAVARFNSLHLEYTPREWQLQIFPTLSLSPPSSPLASKSVARGASKGVIAARKYSSYHSEDGAGAPADQVKITDPVDQGMVDGKAVLSVTKSSTKRGSSKQGDRRSGISDRIGWLIKGSASARTGSGHSLSSGHSDNLLKNGDVTSGGSGGEEGGDGVAAANGGVDKCADNDFDAVNPFRDHAVSQ